MEWTLVPPEGHEKSRTLWGAKVLRYISGATRSSGTSIAAHGPGCLDMA